jgi:hypothetical protein
VQPADMAIRLAATICLEVTALLDLVCRWPSDRRAFGNYLVLGHGRSPRRRVSANWVRTHFLGQTSAAEERRVPGAGFEPARGCPRRDFKALVGLWKRGTTGNAPVTLVLFPAFPPGRWTPATYPYRQFH